MYKEKYYTFYRLTDVQFFTWYDRIILNSRYSIFVILSFSV